MQLQGRNLSKDMQGDDVLLLHSELRQLGYKIPPDEYERSLYWNETEKRVIEFQQKHGLPTTGIVDEATAKAINAEVEALKAFVVKGQILKGNGNSHQNVTVHAFDKDLRSEEFLGQTPTDLQGNYEIRYTAAQFQKAEKQSADLIVRVFDSNNTLLSASPIHFNAQPLEIINFTIGEPDPIPSEYERYLTKLTPLLSGYALIDLREDDTENPEAGKFQDITFLAGETGINRQHIAFLITAAKLAAQINNSPTSPEATLDQLHEATHAVTHTTQLPDAIFYGFFRENLPTELPALLSQSPDILRRALETALRDNIIPADLSDNLDQILAQLQQQVVYYALRTPIVKGSYPLENLLATVFTDNNQTLAQPFLTRYLQHTGDIEDFWKDLRQQPEFQKEGLIENLQFTLQLGALTQNHLPLVQELQQQQQSGELTSLQDLAKFDRDRWLTLLQKTVNDQTINFPPNVPGKDAAEKAQNYATILTQIVEDAFPTAFIAYRVAEANETGQADLRAFFKQNVFNTENTQKFDIATTYLDNYLAANPDAFKGVENPEALTQQIKAMQRVYKIAPRYSEMQVLMANNLFSASSIANLDPSTFINLYGSQLGEARAKTIHNNALQTAAIALALQGELAGNFNSIGMHVLPKRTSRIEGSANLETLFGSLSLCECEHCRSVYSPAAYLVDILSFLKERRLFTVASDGTVVYQTIQRDGRTVDKTAKDVLFDRRPDLGAIELNCENTNTPVPYVDLVNEALENVVSSQTSGTAQSRQTRGTSEELRANPEYVNLGAYHKLAEAVYPWNLPFNFETEELRVYLNHLGVPRHELMRAFYTGETLSDADKLAIAVESLGLTTKEQQIITGESPETLWQFWGCTNNATIPSPETSAEWIGELSKVNVFLSRSGLTYQELTELLKTRFINPDPLNPIEISPDPNCDMGQMSLNRLTEITLNNVHCFVRLWRKLGWSMQELDQAIAALQPKNPAGTLTLTSTFLKQMSHIQQLKAQFNLPLNQLLCLWATIDTHSYRQDRDDSLYASLFKNKAVLNPVDETFKNNPSQSGTVPKLLEHTPTILAALQISAADLKTLITTLNPPTTDPLNPPTTDPDLNLENLSSLYRHTLLAKILKLSINDFLAVKVLIGINPFDPAHTENTLLFIEKVDKIRSSNFTIAELNYLLRHQYQPSTGIAPTTESIVLILGELRNGLQKIVADQAVEPDPTGELVRKKLALLKWDNARIEQAIALLNDSIAYTAQLNALPRVLVFPEALKSRISYNSKAQKLQFIGIMAEAERDELLSIQAPAGTDLEPYKTAVRQIYQTSISAARTFINEKMRAFELPTFPNSLNPLPTLDPLPTGITFPNELRNKIFYDAPAKTLCFVGAMTEVERSQLLDTRRNPAYSNAAYRQAIDLLFNLPKTFTPEPKNQFLFSSDDSSFTQLFTSGKTVAERFDYVLIKLVTYLRTTLSESLIKQKLSEVLNLDISITEQLLTQWVNSFTNSSERAIADFLNPTFVENYRESYDELILTHFKSPFRTLQRLFKTAKLISKLQITAKQLPGVSQYSSIGWLNWNTLPIDSDHHLLFTDWERLVDLLQLQAQFPASDVVLFDLFKLLEDSTTSKAIFLEKLSTLTQWSLSDLETLIGKNEIHDGQTRDNPGQLNLTFPVHFRQSEQVFHRLKACFDLLKRLGASATDIFAWIRPDTDPTDTSNGIKQVAKAKYNNAQWLAIAKPLRDVLREKQRSALVSYLLVNPELISRSSLKDTNDLYAHLLIDVEMSPCQMTSRIKQAISSVQLFVQRCLMNLEADHGVLPNAAIDRGWRNWQWMKNYRVWEANRKIFLYPENWIEPELRDDKTPFFKELENELLQNDVTQEAAESAFLNYLEKLDVVARLEIVGMYHQQETEQPDGQGKILVDILHVFGRTRNTPHIYYYRQQINADYWTPWEKVDVDIQGDHLIPIIWNRRLHLFWPIFTEKAGTPILDDRANMREPAKHWEIQIAWSEYKNGKWAAKNLSQEHMDSRSFLKYGLKDGSDEYLTTHDLEKKYFFTCQLTAEQNLAINCYWHMGQIENDNGIAVLLGFFLLGECHGSIFIHILESIQLRQAIIALSRCVFDSNRIIEDSSDSQSDVLYLANLDATSFNVRRNVPVLSKTPGTFSLVTTYQKVQFIASRPPYIFQDDKKTFFVRDESFELLSWHVPVQVNPGLIAQVSRQYYANPVVISQSVQPVFNSSDFSLFQASFPVNQFFDSIETSSTALFSTSVSIPNTHPAETILVPPIELSATDGVALANILNGSSRSQIVQRYLFRSFYHPYVCKFIFELNQNGIDGLLQRSIQKDLHQEFFVTDYQPMSLVDGNYPIEEVDFSHGGSYAQYNWELFFHVPLIIADRLSKNQRFEEARKWFHYIFDPTDTSGEPVPQRYWRTLPFFQTAHEQYQRERIQGLLQRLASEENDPELEKQVAQWLNNPFNPHLIARLRTTSYQKVVVMKYIDNLIAWGDNLFRKDTIESINEATQLYILAAQILGPRPSIIPPQKQLSAQTYNSLESKLDELSNAPFEYLVPSSRTETVLPTRDREPLPQFSLYFCIPPNDKLLSYWDTVSDRLFKIRQSMNIEGVVQQLPLFEPPIDPALLAKTATLGVDISSALNDINVAQPHYRFTIMVQKATELCADLKTLGASLLSALEKQDAEALALLRSKHEVRILEAVREIKEKQIKEADQTLEGLKKYQDVVKSRSTYYSSRVAISDLEAAHLDQIKGCLSLFQTQNLLELVAGILHLVPDIKAGAPTTLGTTYGGGNVAPALQAFTGALGANISYLSTAGSMSATLGSYQRRSDDWQHQADLADKELKQVDKQIKAAEMRQIIAEKELTNHEQQIQNATDADDYMRTKFTNRELYDWMIGQISGIYFQSYQLAYDIAKRAERCYRFELGLTDSNFIQFGYWDSLKKGLLAGEKLHHDLKRMEISYLDQHKREYEISKQVSLVLHDPLALITLKETGQCEFELPEILFDADYPGHYMRRIKSVSITIPCVTGAYTSVNCTLTLLKNETRISSNSQKPYDKQEDDARFVTNFAAMQSIATSTAQNDSGLFELNFRDERYLPFEGAGAISHWRIDMPKDCNAFNFDTISDVIIRLNYTAREGGESLKKVAKDAMKDAIAGTNTDKTPLARLFSAKHEFPTEWHQFLNSTEQTLNLELSPERFPFQFRGKNLTISKMELFLNLKGGIKPNHEPPKTYTEIYAAGTPIDVILKSPINGDTGSSKPLNSSSSFLNGIPYTLFDELKSAVKSGDDARWSLTANMASRKDDINDLFIVCHYTVAEQSSLNQ